VGDLSAVAPPMGAGRLEGADALRENGARVGPLEYMTVQREKVADQRHPSKKINGASVFNSTRRCVALRKVG